MATGGTVLTQVGREGPFAGGHLAGTWTKEASWTALQQVALRAQTPHGGQICVLETRKPVGA